jgi:hypothetical protein
MHVKSRQQNIAVKNEYVPKVNSGYQYQLVFLIWRTYLNLKS